jgi:hypothetical protein
MNITLDQVKEFLAANKDSKDVTSYLSTFINKDSVNAFLETDDGKALLQPYNDRAVTQGIKTFKEKTMPDLIKQAIAESNPEETPEQRRIRELEETVKNMGKTNEHETLKTKTLTLLSDKKLPTDVISLVLGDDEDATSANIEALSKVIESAVNTEVENRLKGSGGSKDPVKKQSNDSDMTRDKLFELSYKERNKFQRENPEEYERLMGR